MKQIVRFYRDADTQPYQEQQRIVPWLLRELCRELKLSLGSRLLILGTECKALVTSFEDLGIDVSCLIEEGTTPHSETSVPTDSETPSVHTWKLRDRNWYPLHENSVDACLILGHSDYSADLTSRESYWLSTQAISTVRPGGVCGFLLEENAGTETQHQTSCYEQHLEAFPGELRSHQLSTGISLARLLGKSSASPIWVTSVQRDFQSLQRLQLWEQVSSRIMHQQVCCGMSEQVSTTERDAA